MARKVSNKVALSTEVHGDQEVQDGHGKDSKHTVYRKVSTKVIDDSDTVPRQRTGAIATPNAYKRIKDEQLKYHVNRRGREYTKVKERTDGSKRGLEQLHPGDQIWRQDRSQRWGQVKWRTLTETKARPKDSSDPVTDLRDPRTTRKTLPKLKSIPHRRHL